MKLIIDISEENFYSIRSGALYAIGHDKYDGIVTDAFKQGTPYEDRPQGEWVDYNAYYKTCSICKRTVGIDFLIQKYEDKPEEYSFCPNCGAKMI